MILNNLKNKLSELSEKANKAAEAVNKEFEKIKLSEEERNTRYNICQQCEWLWKPTGSCKKCGCFVAVKTYLPNESCPIKKWVRLNNNDEYKESKDTI
jgi:hypothetical protein